MYQARETCAFDCRRRRTFVRAESLDDDCVRPGLKRHHDPRLEPAGIVDVGELGAARFQVVATVKPEPGVVRRSLAGRERVLGGGGDGEPVKVLARAGANDVVSAGGVAGEGAPAGKVARRFRWWAGREERIRACRR